MYEGAYYAMIVVVENEHDDPNSNPKRSCWHFTERQGMYPTILPPAMSK